MDAFSFILTSKEAIDVTTVYFTVFVDHFTFLYKMYVILNSFTAIGDNNRLFANSVDPDEMAHELSHQDLHCFLIDCVGV